jgi:hypothetical protein
MTVRAQAKYADQACGAPDPRSPMGGYLQSYIEPPLFTFVMKKVHDSLARWWEPVVANSDGLRQRRRVIRGADNFL